MNLESMWVYACMNEYIWINLYGAKAQGQKEGFVAIIL